MPKWIFQKTSGDQQGVSLLPSVECENAILYIVLKNFKGLYILPKKFQGLYIVPKKFQGPT